MYVYILHTGNVCYPNELNSPFFCFNACNSVWSELICNFWVWDWFRRSRSSALFMIWKSSADSLWPKVAFCENRFSLNLSFSVRSANWFSNEVFSLVEFKSFSFRSFRFSNFDWQIFLFVLINNNSLYSILKLCHVLRTDKISLLLNKNKKC